MKYLPKCAETTKKIMLQCAGKRILVIPKVAVQKLLAEATPTFRRRK
jgi:hypothetical protein